jgi:crotonobetainyl-CoA:carnitine CoA-transferase CaiB-like acyl-CoA transferase
MRSPMRRADFFTARATMPRANARRRRISHIKWPAPSVRCLRSEAHVAEIGKAFADFIARFDAEQFANEAQARHLAAAPLNTIGEFVGCEQNRARGWLQEIDHPVIGRYTAPGFPLRLSLTPMRVRRSAPLLNEDREEIIGELERIPCARITLLTIKSARAAPCSRGCAWLI